MNNLTAVQFEFMPFKEQIEILVHGDVFVSVVGSSSVNMIYMVPHSVVISAMPPYQVAPFFDNLAKFSRIHYMTIYNTTAPIVEECKEYITTIGQIRENNSCHTLYYYGNVYIPPGVLYDYTRLAQDYVRFYKYYGFEKY